MTFTGWMRRQTARDNAVGELARLAATDGGFPGGQLGGYRAWESYLTSKAASPGMIQALKTAWYEYGGRE